MTPEQLVAETSLPMNSLGAVYYFHPDTLAVGKELGLDGFRWYVLGRGGVLGDVEAPVVQSAFGYFHGDVIAKMWNSARDTVAPRQASTRHLQCNADIGRAKLQDVAELEAFCEAAEAVIATVDPSALALYAGYAAEPLPDDVAGRAMQLFIVHRELRGSQHLAAIVAAGLHPGVAHALRRPADIDTFGWNGIEIPPGAQVQLDAIDLQTNVLNAAAYAPLSDAQRRAYVDGVNAATQALKL